MERGENYAERVDDILTNALTEASKPVDKAIKGHGVITQAMFWSFAGAFTALIAFAIKNLPF